MAIREGKWRCPNCSNVNRGAQMKCNGCGQTRDENVQFFLEEDAAEVTDEALLQRAQAGAEWLCEYCSTSNEPAAKVCKSCGAERGGARAREVREIRPQVAPLASSPSSGGGWAKWVVLALLLSLGCCCGLGLFFNRKSEDQVRVQGFEWERSIPVQAQRLQREEAWDDAVPAGARVIGSRQEVRRTEHEKVGTRKVKVGKKDLGNGFFEDVYEDQPVYKDRPVYGRKVTFEILRWVDARVDRASGQDQSPYWPRSSLGGREREGPRREKYVVLLQGQKTYRMEMPEARWRSLQVGQTFQAVIRGGDRVEELR